MIAKRPINNGVGTFCKTSFSDCFRIDIRPLIYTCTAQEWEMALNERWARDLIELSFQVISFNRLSSMPAH